MTRNRFGAFDIQRMRKRLEFISERSAADIPIAQRTCARGAYDVSVYLRYCCIWQWPEAEAGPALSEGDSNKRSPRSSKLARGC